MHEVRTRVGCEIRTSANCLDSRPHVEQITEAQRAAFARRLPASTADYVVIVGANVSLAAKALVCGRWSDRLSGSSCG